MKYRAGIFCSSSSWGGLEINTLRLLRWMRDEGIEMPAFFLDGGRLQNAALEGGFPVAPIAKMPAWRGLQAVHRWVATQKIDVVICVFNRDLKLLSAYKRLVNSRIRIVYQQHMRLGLAKRDIIHTLRYRAIDAWVAPLNYLKEETLRRTRVSPEKIHVIPFGIDTGAFINDPMGRVEARRQLRLPEDKLIIGLLGRIDPQKGQDTVIEAIHVLRSRHGLDVHLLLMGEATLHEGDAQSRKISALVQQYDLAGAIHLRPYQEDTIPFFRGVDVLAMASHHETFGMVTIEAMAAGLAVIGSDAGGTKELLEDGRLGYLFKAQDAEDFARAFVAMMVDAAKEERLRAAREAVLRRYTAGRMCESIVGLLDRL